MADKEQFGRMMYRMYGAEFSLYSGKLRSYLRKKGLDFEEIRPSILTYKRFIVPRTGVGFIPVLQTPEDQVVQDTTEIIDFLERRHGEPSVYPTGPVQKLVALLLEVYGDEWLLIPAMHYRWNFPEENQPFINEEFGRLLFPWLPAFMQRALGRRVGKRFAGLLPALGITKEMKPAIEGSYLALLDDLDRHFADHAFLLGERPSIGDFGLIAPLYAHLYRDPYPGRLMRERSPNVARWVERMVSEEPARGEFLADDAVPDTLMPVLSRMADEQVPVLLDTAYRLAEWQEEDPGTDRIPRALGRHRFRIEGVEGERAVLPFALWMWQRPMDHVQALRGQSRKNADELLEKLRMPVPEKLPRSPRVERKDNRFVAAE